MGYRSDVGLALTKKGVKALNAKLAEESVSEELRESVMELLDDADQHYTDRNSGAELWYWESIKWYDTLPLEYQNICCIMETLANLKNEDYRFIRIGEDYEDTEVSGGFWENPFGFGLKREITFSAAA